MGQNCAARCFPCLGGPADAVLDSEAGKKVQKMEPEALKQALVLINTHIGEQQAFTEEKRKAVEQQAEKLAKVVHEVRTGVGTHTATYVATLKTTLDIARASYDEQQRAFSSLMIRRAGVETALSATRDAHRRKQLKSLTAGLEHDVARYMEEAKEADAEHSADVMEMGSDAPLLKTVGEQVDSVLDLCDDDPMLKTLVDKHWNKYMDAGSAVPTNTLAPYQGFRNNSNGGGTLELASLRGGGGDGGETSETTQALAMMMSTRTSTAATAPVTDEEERQAMAML